jgi:hypothetical protein
MSLRQIQTRNFLEFIISSYLASGKRPTDTEIYKALNFYFSKQPAGRPIVSNPDLFSANGVSGVEGINDFMAAVQVNLDNLFQQIDEHLQQNGQLTTALMAQIKALRTKRRRIEGRVDDLLLGLYNTDGYFYSVSDDFFDGDFTDFSYTNAFLDTESGIVSLPSNSDQTKVMSLHNSNEPIVEVFNKSNSTQAIPFQTHMPFSNAVDGLSNTVWYLTIKRTEPSEGVLVRLNLDIYNSFSDVNITQIALTPHGIEPVQCSVQKVIEVDSQTSNTQPFSNYIKTSAEKIIFINENPSNQISRLIFELAKDKPDYYEDNIDGTRSWVYIVGIKELMLTQQAYDPQAVFVSRPLGISEELYNDHVIDSVTLVTKHDVPANSSLRYYVAANNENATTLEDFDWHRISPLLDRNKTAADSIVRFGGATREQRNIRKNSRGPEDIGLIPINKYSKDLTIRNPSNSLSPEFEIYRIAAFKELFLTGTITLEEGINTTKILHTALTDENLENTFPFWAGKFDAPGSYRSAFGETDTGNGFFYGADIGENQRSVYVETGVYVDEDSPVVLKDIVKKDPNSKLWALKAFLNGREIADMPVGVNRVTAPLKLTRGKNVIVFAINIPASSNASLIPYIGAIDFDMNEFGGYKLGELAYVDLFKFKDNGYREANNISPNKWFTIYNGEIITRSIPTNNYRLRFASPTERGPKSIRLRADLSRSEQNNLISPVLDSYRIRFSYADKEI